MLRRLHIRNFLLIDKADLQWEKGFTAITGETGSGKSILLGALALAMGERADAAALREPDERCVIELEVDLDGMGLQDWFAEQELPFETPAILRRQLEVGGRSRAFINDTPVRLDLLRELASRLVHVHSQHHTLLLNDPRFQLGLVDHAAGKKKEVDRYAVQFVAWRALVRELELLRDQQVRAQAEAAFQQFQFDELEAAHLVDGEQDTLEQELSRAEHASELAEGLAAVETGIDGDQGVLMHLSQVRQSLAKSARFDPRVKSLADRLDAAHIELKDIASESAHRSGEVNLDPREAERLRERLDLLLRLQHKHRVNTVHDLIVLRDTLSLRLAEVGGMDERIVVLEREESALRERITELARSLSKARIKAMAGLAARVQDILVELGMPHALFRFAHQVEDEPGPQGIDRIRALFSANKDREPAALDKVASGGELGRVMLALISLAADSRDLPTVIFDEIDTGVSGEVADRVGGLMERMGRDRQVLAITHLPQIAGKAANHLLVTKQEKGARVTTSIQAVTEHERVEALAQMLSGRKLTKAALANARELLKPAS